MVSNGEAADPVAADVEQALTAFTKQVNTHHRLFIQAQDWPECGPCREMADAVVAAIEQRVRAEYTAAVMHALEVEERRRIQETAREFERQRVHEQYAPLVAVVQKLAPETNILPGLAAQARAALASLKETTDD